MSVLKKILKVYRETDEISRKAIFPIRSIRKSRDEEIVKRECFYSLGIFWLLSLAWIVLFCWLKIVCFLFLIPLGFISGFLIIIIKRFKYPNSECPKILIWYYGKCLFGLLFLGGIVMVLYYICRGLGG